MSTTTGRLLRHAWSVVSWIVLSGLVTGVAAALYYYHSVEDQLRSVVEARLAESYPELTIRVGLARILKGEGIQLRQISIVPAHPQASTHPSEMAYVESLTLRCDASLPALLQGKLSVKQIVCVGLALHLQRDVRERWNVADFIPTQPFTCADGPLPEITIENASWQVHDERDDGTRTLSGDGVNLRVQLKHVPTPPATLHPSASDVPQMLIALEGSFRAPFCQRVDLEGVARTSDGAWTMQGQLVGANWSTDLRRQLPSFLADYLPQLEGLRARADLQFRLHQKSRSVPLRYEITGRVADAHWHDPRWPQPLSNISCNLHIDPSGCQVKQLVAAFGTARLGGDLVAHGHSLSQPYELELTLDRFPVTSGFVASLPTAWQDVWQKFRAEGLFSGGVRLQFDGQQHHCQSELTVSDLAFTHYKFPYRVSECQGSLNVSNDTCQFDLVGSAGGIPVTMRGTIHQPGPDFTGWWEAKTTRWKSIDDEMIAALPPNAGTLVRRMQLRGNVGFWVRYQRSDPTQHPLPDMSVAFDQAWINYDAFSYPISDIQGRLEARDGRWTFRQLEGWNDSCHIRCDGYWDSHDPSQPLELNFQVSNVGLDDELKHALSPAAQQLWSQLRPGGRVDKVDVRFFKTIELMRPELDIQVAHGTRAASPAPAEGVQLRPTWLPLGLSNVRGEARLRGTTLVLRACSAEHGRARLQTNGTGEILPDGRWKVNLNNLAIDRLELTDSVMRALPPQLAQSAARLGLGGTYAVSGGIHFEREDRTAPIASSWDLELNVEQGRVAGQLPVTGVFGQVQMNGAAQGTQFWARGNLQLDSLVCQGVQLTSLEGPFWLDSTHIVLGRRVPAQTADQTGSRPLTGNVYQGKLSGNAEVLLNPERDFSVQVNITSADVTALSRDWQLGKGSLAGQAYLELFLTGSNRGRHTLRGNGTAQLRNANLYELPLILALLNRIGSGRTDNTAFSSTDIAFHVSDGYVYFDRFDLTGDAITLKGIGEMRSERQLSLDFYSIVGREQLWSPLVRPFLGEASRQFLLIHVDGTLSDPQTRQEVLPGLNETLQQLFPELMNPANANRQADGRSRRGPLGILPWTR